MLRSIRSTAFLGTLLLTGVAAAQTKPAPAASDENLIESGKPGAAPADAPAPAKEAEAAAAPVAVPAPPPPPADEPAVEAPKAQKKHTVGGAGLDTQAVTIGGASDVGDSSSEKDWGFKFKGFFRAPMRIGIDNSGSLSTANGQLQFHAPPVTPDSNYTRWMYTNISPGPWAELLFQYGNQRVMMTTSIASYNITSGGWRELQDQLGIDRAFLTMKFPEALGNLGGMAYDVGIFSNRYGAMGKYDAGEYETYIIGRTRLAGITATADMEVSDDLKLVLEGGGGAKVDQQWQTYTCNGNNPSTATCSATYDYPSWMPYPGDKVQQGTNLLVHGHGGFVISSILTAQLHYINSFVRDARWNVGTTGGANASGNGAVKLDASAAPGKASIQVLGGDLKLDGGWMGDGYIGASYLMANNPLVINDSIEVLHSQGGWQLAHNYFTHGSTSGNIFTVAGQYTFSVASFMMRPRPFWGQAADITIRPFFMYNKVMGASTSSDNVSKLKGGVEGVYSFLPQMAAGFRWDMVQPNMSNSSQSFMVFSPKLIFRSEFVTHEAIVLQYSYYAYGSSYTDPTKVSDLMPWPFGTYGINNIGSTGYNMQPDKHVVTLYANMWW
jgi:hypothetical protein